MLSNLSPFYRPTIADDRTTHLPSFSLSPPSLNWKRARRCTPSPPRHKIDPPSPPAVFENSLQLMRNNMMGTLMDTRDRGFGNVAGTRADDGLWFEKEDHCVAMLRVPKGGELNATLDPSGQFMTIKGQGTNEDGNWVYERTSKLPHAIKPSEVNVCYGEGPNEGTLTIQIPQRQAAAPQQATIQIKGAKKAIENK